MWLPGEPGRRAALLLAATAVGAAAGAVLGRFAKHRLESGIAEKMDTARPPGSGGVIAVSVTDGAGAVGKALAITLIGRSRFPAGRVIMEYGHVGEAGPSARGGADTGCRTG
jgi:hypothetical protein